MLDIILESLQDPSFIFKPLTSSKDLWADIEAFQPGLILTDKLMADRSGNDIIQQVRQSPRYCAIPIIILSGQTDLAEKVLTLQLGADDYLTKPFSPEELKARVIAVIRRSRRSSMLDSQTAKSPLVINAAAHTVTIFEREIALTLTEYKILELLNSHVKHTVTRGDIVIQALGSTHVSGRTIDVHIASLRYKLGEFGRNIVTVRGIGYKLTG